MEFATTIEAIAGRGLAGDRYERNVGTYSKFPGAHDVTLFEMEAIWTSDVFRASCFIRRRPEETSSRKV